MRRDNCTLDQFEAWFESECVPNIHEPGLKIVGPISTALGNPDAAPWNADFAIIYPDNMYIRIKECYCQLPKKEGGDRGRLLEFAYHYGPCKKKCDTDGFPLYDKRSSLRIDLDTRIGYHIHYMKEDHVLASRVHGLDFGITPSKFIKAVESHRASGKPLHEILGFKVVPA